MKLIAILAFAVVAGLQAFSDAGLAIHAVESRAAVIEAATK